MYYMSYATANDDPLFHYDRIHLFRMTMLDSGIDNIKIFISISKVTDVTASQEEIINRIIAETNKMSRGRLRIDDAEFKSNTGRDFSSHSCNLKKIAKIAKDGDSILFLNRSAYGPLTKNWYLAFLNQAAKYNNVAICGNTINLSGHPDVLQTQQNQSHVQTYAFLSKFPFLFKFVECFPAEKCIERLDVIKDGEIALSQEALLLGYQITSLAWPDMYLSRETFIKSNYPTYDIKSDLFWARNLPFRYKFNGYNKKILSIIPVFKSNILKLRLSLLKLARQLNFYKNNCFGDF